MKLHLMLYCMLSLVLLTFISNCKRPDVEQSTKKSTKADPMSDKGIGPVKSVVIDEKIDTEMAKRGEALFQLKCSSCHKLADDYIGPALGEVSTRRSPEWIMNMILNPEEMIEKNALVQALLETYPSRMVSMGLDEKAAREILEYLRSSVDTSIIK